MPQRSLSFFIILFLLNVATSIAQNSERECQSDIILKNDFLSNEKMRSETISAENAIKDFTAQNRTQGTHYTIPVIVHILYHDSTENIPDSQIVKMLTIMNQDFGRTNPDTINTPAVFQPVASASSFEFCFATHDSAGNASTGIEHVYTDTIQFSTPFGMQSHGVLPWNTDQYFNIWIGNATGFTYSYSTPVSIYPTYHANYGLMISNNYVSQLQLGDTSQYSGRDITHSLGHCFNLKHLFSLANCVDQDSVSDTPFQIDPTLFCPSFPLLDNCNITSPGTMFMNFMDINEESCMNMFTVGQANRMDASLNLFYPQLLTSNGCLWDDINQNNVERINVYPNPSNGVFRIDMNKRNLRLFTVTDICNRTVDKGILPDTEPFDVDLTLLRSGIYFLNLTDENSFLYATKIIKL